MRRFLGAVPWGRLFVSLVLAVAVVVVVPGHFGLWRVYPFTQALAMQGLLWLGLAVLGVLAGWVTLRNPEDRWLRVGAALAIVLVVLESGRLLWGGLLSSEAGGSDRPADLVVVNANVGDAPVDAVATALTRLDPDVVMLVEADAQMVQQVAEAMPGRSWQVFANADQATGTVDALGMLVSDEVGRYDVAEVLDLSLGGLVLEPAEEGPVLGVVHPYPPIPGRNPASRWRAEVRETVAVCERYGGVIGGDYNATGRQIARSGLQTCASATSVLGLGHRGTWPANWPAVLGSPIDHQLFDDGLLRPVSGAIVDVDASDHRAVVVRYAYR